MDLRKLKKLIDLVEESGIAELEVTEGEEKVRIVKHASAITARAPRTAPPASQRPSVGHVPAAMRMNCLTVSSRHRHA